MDKQTAQSISNAVNMANRSMKRLNEIFNGRCDRADETGTENTKNISDNNDAIMELVELVSENNDAIMEIVEIISSESEGV